MHPVIWYLLGLFTGVILGVLGGTIIVSGSRADDLQKIAYLEKELMKRSK